MCISISPEQRITLAAQDRHGRELGTDEVPDYAAGRRDFKDASVQGLANKRVAICEPLNTTHNGAKKRPALWVRKLPTQLTTPRVQFEGP